MKIGKIAAIIIMLALITQGCVPLAIMYGADKMSKARVESAEKMQRSTDLQTYANYRVNMERVNLEREKAKLRPQPIMTQEEWISAQTAGRPPIAPTK